MNERTRQAVLRDYVGRMSSYEREAIIERQHDLRENSSLAFHYMDDKHDVPLRDEYGLENVKYAELLVATLSYEYKRLGGEAKI